MTVKTTLKCATLAVTMFATLAQAQAENSFATLAGVAAEPMNAQEMDAVQGKGFPEWVFYPAFVSEVGPVGPAFWRQQLGINQPLFLEDQLGRIMNFFNSGQLLP